MHQAPSRNSLNALQTLTVGDKSYTYFSLKAAEHTLGDLSHLPCCMRILLENLLRHEDDQYSTQDDMRALTAYHALHKNIPTVSFHPSRFLIDDKAALSTLTDLAALKEEMDKNGLAQTDFETDYPLDIVIEASTEPLENQAEHLGLIKWAEKNLPHIRVIPPGHGPSNHIGLHALGDVVKTIQKEGQDTPLVVPDTVLGTGRFFSAINGLGILGWNTDPMEIQSLILGNTSRLALPGVMGVKLTGKIHKSGTTNDLALTIAAFLTKSKPSGKIVEFYGPGLDHLSLHDRAVIARLVGEVGALCCYFPIDATTVTHLGLVGCAPDHIALVEAYAKQQGFWREQGAHDQKEATFTIQMDFPLDSVRPCLGEITRTTVVPLADTVTSFEQRYPAPPLLADPLATVKHGDVVLAILSSFEAATPPQELLMAGLVARKADRLGLRVKPWVRCFFNDQSPVSLALLERTGLKKDLEAIGFHFPQKQARQDQPLIQESVEKAVIKNKITTCAIASIPQHEEYQITAFTAVNFITASPLVVGYALAGSLLLDLNTKPLATSADGKPVFLKELWPSAAEIHALLEASPLAPLYVGLRERLLTQPADWASLPATTEGLFEWKDASYLIRKPPQLAAFERRPPAPRDIKNARALAIFGDDVAASVLAPSGSIDSNSPAGHYLASRNAPLSCFTTFGTKTGNFEIMIRGAMTNPALKNALVPPHSSSSGLTVHVPSNTPMTFFDAAQKYQQESVPTTIIGGKNFGHGVQQEWATKVIRFLGVSFVIAESFAPMFRVNLLRLGVLPLHLKQGISLTDLQLTGTETLHVAGITEMERPPCEVMLTIERSDGVERYMVHCGIKTMEELEMFRNGSLWAHTLRGLLQS